MLPAAARSVLVLDSVFPFVYGIMEMVADLCRPDQRREVQQEGSGAASGPVGGRYYSVLQVTAGRIRVKKAYVI